MSNANAAVSIQVSPGELLDRAAILALEAERTLDPERAGAARARLAGLALALDAIDRAAVADLEADLAFVDGELWQVLAAQRHLERSGDFGPAYVEAARTIAHMNERREALKAAIDARLVEAPD